MPRLCNARREPIAPPIPPASPAARPRPTRHPLLAPISSSFRSAQSDEALADAPVATSAATLFPIPRVPRPEAGSIMPPAIRAIARLGALP